VSLLGSMPRQPCSLAPGPRKIQVRVASQDRRTPPRLSSCTSSTRSARSSPLDRSERSYPSNSMASLKFLTGLGPGVLPPASPLQGVVSVPQVCVKANMETEEVLRRPRGRSPVVNTCPEARPVPLTRAHSSSLSQRNLHLALPCREECSSSPTRVTTTASNQTACEMPLRLPATHESFMWLNNSVAMPLMWRAEDLGRAYQHFEEANVIYLAMHGVPSKEVMYNQACCFSLGAAAISNRPHGGDPSPGLPPTARVSLQELADRRLDLALAALDKAVAAGYRDGKSMEGDRDLQALRERRPAEFAATVQRALCQSESSSSPLHALPQPASPGGAFATPGTPCPMAGGPSSRIARSPRCLPPGIKSAPASVIGPPGPLTLVCGVPTTPSRQQQSVRCLGTQAAATASPLAPTASYSGRLHAPCVGRASCSGGPGRTR